MRLLSVRVLGAAAAIAMLGCVGSINEVDPEDGDGNGSASGGASSSGQGASNQTGAGQTGAGQTGAGAGQTGAGQTGAGGAAQTGAGGQTTSGQTGAGQTTGAGGSTGDPFAAARTACMDKINDLRIAKGLAPYARWTAGEACADGQATSDQASNDPHGAFGDCGESGQNECLGGQPGNIEGCLQGMWNEYQQAGCSGCDACAGAYNPNCPNCDFFGDLTGDVCGHYVNMSAQYLGEAACGFSAQGGWAVINFR